MEPMTAPLVDANEDIVLPADAAVRVGRGSRVRIANGGRGGNAGVTPRW